MKLSDKINALRDAGYRVSYARRGQYAWSPGGAWNRDADRWEAYEACPRYLSYSDVSDSPGGHDGTFTRAFVDLGRDARGDDQADQTDAYQFSNYRSLWRDYPEGIWTDISYSNVNSLGAYVANLTEDVLDILAGLQDYPLYDEEDHSSLEHEQVEEAWADYWYWDVPRELADITASDEALEDAIDALPAEGEGSLREMFYSALYEACSDAGEYPYLETATSVVVPKRVWADALEATDARIWRERCEAFRPEQPALFS